MITSPPEENFVSLVSPLAFETVKQSPKNRDSERNKSETNSLKTLALKVLQRNSTRNKSETKPKNRVKQKPEKTASCFTENEPLVYTETEQHTKYKTAPFMVSVTGKPQFCIHCQSWTQNGNWWKGLCGASGDHVTNKSRCTLKEMEVVQ